MSPFLLKYTEQVNIPTSTVVPELTLNSVEVVILQFGQVLWFGNRMKKITDKLKSMLKVWDINMR